MENESRSHYNRAGQIPLALSEIEHGEQRAGGSGACPYQRERVSSADVTNPPGRIEQAHTNTHAHPHTHTSKDNLGKMHDAHTIFHTEDNWNKQKHTPPPTHTQTQKDTHKDKQEIKGS